MRKKHSYDYDVIIIGTGIGGLTTGAYLAKSSARVLLCEQHSRPGGCFTSFKHKGYTFDAGIQGCEDFGVLKPMLKQLGLLEKIEFKKTSFGIYDQGFSGTFNNRQDIRRYFGFLKKKYPHELKSLRFIEKTWLRGYALMDKQSELNSLLYKNIIPAILNYCIWTIKNSCRTFNLLYDMLNFFRFAKTPFEDYVSNLIKDEDLIKRISANVPYGLPVSFVVPFFYCLSNYLYPSRGGMQSIPDLLAGYIIQNNGRIVYNKMVDKIISENGRAIGIQINKGSEIIRARFIVNNGDPKNTFQKMIDDKAVPEYFKKEIRETGTCESIFAVFLGLNMKTEEIPVKDCQHLSFIPGDEIVDQKDLYTDPDYYRKAGMLISIPTLHDETLAPPDKSIVILYTIARMNYLNQWYTVNGQQTEEYYKLKEKIAAQLINSAEKLIPGLTGKIDVKISASPVTYKRYTMNTDGSAQGWTMHPGKTFNRKKLIFKLIKTPLKNLYQVGHWSYFPGSAVSAIMSGKIVSTILKFRLWTGI